MWLSAILVKTAHALAQTEVFGSYLLIARFTIIQDGCPRIEAVA